jgi:inhibitor of cysteine peptidase
MNDMVSIFAGSLLLLLLTGIPVLAEGVCDQASLDIGVVDMDGNNTTESISLKLGEELNISLESNPTTGYMWNATFDQSKIEQVNYNYEPASPGLTGSGGIETFTFKAVASGETELVMRYKRAWEEEAIKERIYQITITE